MYIKQKLLKVRFCLYILFCLCFSFIKSQDAFDKNNLNYFLNGLLNGGLIGVEMGDFSINTINYSDFSRQVDSLISDYQLDQIDSISNFLKSLGNIFHTIAKQAEASEFTGPTSELLNKFSVPLLIPGEFIFTSRTSLIVYEVSLSDEMWKGEKINLSNLTSLGNKLGILAAKLFYNGKYDFDLLFPLAFPSLRLLQSVTNNSNMNIKPTWTKKSYQNLDNQSLFSLKLTKLGRKNPNNVKELNETKRLKVRVITKNNSTNTTKNIRNLQISTNPPIYDFRTTYSKCNLEIRDQKSCGSCWAFSSSGVLEKRICQNSNSSLINRLSPQFLVSCSKEDSGCDGGTMYGSWNFLQNTGAVLDSCYPYLSQNSVCPTKCVNGSDLKFYKTVPNTITLIKGNIESIKTEIIKGGPVESSFVEIYSDFFNYGSGIYISDKKTFIGYHAMQIIGWGDGYWIVENSWGSGWGENGTIRIPYDQISISDYVLFATPNLNTDNKIICPSNCNSCIDSNTCIKDGCAPNYIINSNGGCSKCPENCNICQLGGCPDGQCSLGYRNDATNGNCLACPSNCQKCDNNGCLLDGCIAGYKNDGNGKCIKCGENCSSCNNEGCTSCLKGFILDSTTKICKKCQTNCGECDSKGCITCINGFFKKSNGTCSNCPDNCKTCSISTLNPGCKKCDQGYSIEKSGNCLKCSENCSLCSKRGCLKCNAGFYLSNGQCIKCGDNCNVCNSNGCLSYGCTTGFYTDSKGLCVKCGVNCSSCKSTGCVKCLDGFSVKSADKTCIKCSENCIKCTENKCLSCALNFKVSSNGTCYKCPENCLNCNKKGCLKGSCEKGFGNNNSGGCSKCPDNCSSCGVNGCNNGYCMEGYGNNSTGGCTKCSDNCLKCANNLCTSCKGGFALSKDKISCISCLENCKSCNSNGCLECKDGFYISANKCAACSPNCANCISNKCLKCFTGFKLSNLNTGNTCVKNS